MRYDSNRCHLPCQGCDGNGHYRMKNCSGTGMMLMRCKWVDHNTEDVSACPRCGVDLVGTPDVICSHLRSCLHKKDCNCRKCYSTYCDHGELCKPCCPHDQGRFQLGEHYEEDVGKWKCKRGCGKLWNNENGED